MDLMNHLNSTSDSSQVYLELHVKSNMQIKNIICNFKIIWVFQIIIEIEN